MRYESVSSSRNTEHAARPSRILVDLAEGWLDDNEVEAVAEWLSASAPAAPPQHVVELGLRARREAYSAVS
jgi:hypothetical protein